MDGFIIEGTKTALPNPNIDLYKKIDKMGLPIVFINGVYPELQHAVSVLSDDRQGGYDACQFLIGKGHRKIAGIFKSDDAQGLGRYAGMTSAMIDNGLCVHDDHVLWFTTADQSKQIDAFALDIIKDCTAVICYNDQVAVKLIELLRSNHYRIPEDMSVISFDNSTLSDVAAVKITSLDYPKERLGQLAAEKLLHMLQGIPETSVRMPWGFSEKEST
jgi:GntR family transcriptional regulator of arabinose operon